MRETAEPAFGLRSMLRSRPACRCLATPPPGTITLLASAAYGAAELELALEIARRTAAAIEIERLRGAVPVALRGQPEADVGLRRGDPGVSRRQRAASRKYGYSREEFLTMRITDIRQPEDVAPGARRSADRTRQNREYQESGDLEAPQEGRKPDRGRDHVPHGLLFEDRPRPASSSPRTSPGAKRLEQQLARRRRWKRSGGSPAVRARLQQPADGHRRLRRDPAGGMAGRGRSGVVRARRPRRPRSRASCSPSAAARCWSRRCSTSTRSSPRMEKMLDRLIGEDVIAHRAGVRPAWSRPTAPDRARDHEPRRQRA